MASNYPSSIDNFTDPSGTSLITTPDHAGLHTDVNDAIFNIQTVLGTTSATAALKNITAGRFALAGSADTFQKGTINMSLFSTGTISGGTLTGAVGNSGTVTGGVYNGASFGTPTIVGGTVAVSGTVTPLSFGAGIAPTVITLTDSAGGTITPNAQAGQVFHMVLGTTAGNRTLGTPANAATDGQPLVYRIKQNTNNTGTLVWPAIYRFNANGTPTLGTTSSYNYYAWRYNAIDTKWDFQGNSGGVV